MLLLMDYRRGRLSRSLFFLVEDGSRFTMNWKRPCYVLCQGVPQHYSRETIEEKNDKTLPLQYRVDDVEAPCLFSKNMHGNSFPFVWSEIHHPQTFYPGATSYAKIKEHQIMEVQISKA